jgi:hypothetical protein
LLLRAAFLRASRTRAERPGNQWRADLDRSGHVSPGFSALAADFRRPYDVVIDGETWVLQEDALREASLTGGNWFQIRRCHLRPEHTRLGRIPGDSHLRLLISAAGVEALREYARKLHLKKARSAWRKEHGPRWDVGPGYLPDVVVESVDRGSDYGELFILRVHVPADQCEPDATTAALARVRELELSPRRVLGERALPDGAFEVTLTAWKG